MDPPYYARTKASNVKHLPVVMLSTFSVNILGSVKHFGRKLILGIFFLIPIKNQLTSKEVQVTSHLNFFLMDCQVFFFSLPVLRMLLEEQIPAPPPNLSEPSSSALQRMCWCLLRGWSLRPQDLAAVCSSSRPQDLAAGSYQERTRLCTGLALTLAQGSPR